MTLAEGRLHAAAAGRARGPDAAGSRRTILVVDDEPAILDLLAELLADEGFVVHAVSDARQAVGRALDARPTLILTDLMMPYLDGRAVLAQLRAQPQTAPIPVLLMSAAGPAEDGAAFDGFLAKPFTIDALLAALQPHLP